MSVTFEKIEGGESWKIFDAAARSLLHVSAEEFVDEWDRGGYADSDDTAVMRVAMLRPSGR